MLRVREARLHGGSSPRHSSTCTFSTFSAACGSRRELQKYSAEQGAQFYSDARHVRLSGQPSMPTPRPAAAEDPRCASAIIGPQSPTSLPWLSSWNLCVDAGCHPVLNPLGRDHHGWRSAYITILYRRESRLDALVISVSHRQALQLGYLICEQTLYWLLSILMVGFFLRSICEALDTCVGGAGPDTTQSAQTPSNRDT
jgi:hypothetical protein